MGNVREILENYYNNYDEEARLVRDKTHTIEFITTTKFADKYLKNGDRILEIGAGTGRYTIHYAKKGFKVDAVELIKKNLDILKSKGLIINDYDKAKDIWMVDERSDIFIVSFIYRVPIRKKVRRRR